MAEFGLKIPFDIDHGELDELPRNECFVLGYEFATIMALLEAKPAADFVKLIHSRNRDRIVKQVRRLGWNYEFNFLHDDRSEEWMELHCYSPGTAI